MQRFAAASALGGRTNSIVLNYCCTGIHRVHPMKLLPMSPAAYAAGTWTGGAAPKWAQDYVDYCRAAKVSVCLYVPDSSDLGYIGSPGGGGGRTQDTFYDYDPLITDPTLCAEENGALIGGPGTG